MQVGTQLLFLGFCVFQQLPVRERGGVRYFCRTLEMCIRDSGNIWAFVTQMAPIYPAYVRNADGSIMVAVSYTHL